MLAEERFALILEQLNEKRTVTVQQLCEAKKIPYQKFVNRSDIPGGSTLGSIASALLPVKTVDIGLPLLAMHSARELMGKEDQKALCDCVREFFSVCQSGRK